MALRRDASATPGIVGPVTDPGLYGPDSEAWQLNREAFLLLAAGPRALLLQISHPLVAEGVDQHSDFRSDPWRRLHNTLRSYLTVVYGTTAQGRDEIRRLNRLHRGIRGPVRDPQARARHGNTYSARDPDLAMWVHATLVDSTLVAADQWLAPIERARRERFYQETRPIGRALGIPEATLPQSLDGFEAYLDRMLAPDGPVRPTPAAREIARHILRPPLGPVIPPLAWVPTPAYRWTMWPALDLLPPRIRDELGLKWTPLHGAVSAWLTQGFRLWRPLIPTSIRWMPKARAADARVATANDQ
jgi:uncharacterized protein (DUF2236 family)